jgi:integrase
VALVARRQGSCYRSISARTAVSSSRGASRPTDRCFRVVAFAAVGGLGRLPLALIVIQRQLGHSNLGITSVYLQGIDNAEIIETVHARRAPMIPVSASLRL